MSADLDGARLWAWSRRARRRGRWLTVPRALALTALGAAAAWIALAPSAGAASERWVVVAIGVLATLALAIPQQMFWRPDAAILARLPITGQALLGAALRDVAVSAAQALVALLVVAAPLAVWSPERLGRHVVVAVGGTTLTGALVAAVGVAAAAMVGAALARAPALAATARELGAQASAPATGWLGILPGLAAAGALTAVVLSRPYVRDGAITTAGDARVLLGVAALVALGALALSTRATAGMAIALREVAALDRLRLAHLEIQPPSAVERMLIARLAPAGARLLHKDARLMRRRYPMAWIVGAATWGAGAIVAMGAVASPTAWLLATGLLAGAYLATLGGRLAHAPIELPRLLAMMPVPLAAAARAKRAWLLGWLLVFPVPALALGAASAPLAAGVAALLVLLGAALAAVRAGALGYHPGHGG